MPKNIVKAGAYEGGVITLIPWKMAPCIVKGFFDTTKVMLDKDTVKQVEILDVDNRKSASSAILRGGVGALLLGPIGLAAALSAKNKKSHNIAIYFRDGKQCVAEVDNNVLQSIQKFTFNEVTPEKKYITDNNIDKTEDSILEQLERLAALKEKGILSDDEFAQQKALILGKRNIT